MTKTYESERYAIPFTTDAIAKRPTEATILSRIVNALKKAGNPVVKVWDTEEESPVSTAGDVIHLAYNLDELYLHTQSGAWVRIIMGEGYEALTDYSVSLEDALAPVSDWLDTKL